MRDQSHITSAVCVLSVVLLAPQSPAAEVPADVVRQLEASEKNLSPLTIAWERRRTSEIPKEEFAKFFPEAVPREDHLAPSSTIFKYDAPRIHLYQTKFYLPRDLKTLKPLKDKPLRRQFQEVAYDRKHVYLGHGHDEENAILGVHMWVRDSKTQSRYYHVSYFERTGWNAPESGPDFGRKIRSHVLNLLDARADVEGMEEATIGDHACWRLQIEGPEYRWQFYLDRAHGCAIRRLEKISLENETLIVVENDQFERVGDRDVWLPRRVRARHFATYYSELDEKPPSAKPIFVEEFEVAPLDGNRIPDETFDLRQQYTRSGTTVVEMQLGPAAKDEKVVRYRTIP